VEVMQHAYALMNMGVHDLNELRHAIKGGISDDEEHYIKEERGGDIQSLETETQPVKRPV
jgi:hypothetical protein